MSYYKQRQDGYGYQNNGYQNNGYQNNGYRNNGYQNNSQRQHKRKSGCKYGNDKNGKPYVQGWKLTKRMGMISFLAVPTKSTGSHKSKAGIEWQNWMIKVSFKDQFREEIYSGLFNTQTRTVHIKDLNLIMKPSTPRGGWIGDPSVRY